MMMDTVQEQAIFENAGQAVHVAFLVMAQEAMQDAPLRMALIRMMESIKLDNMNQRHWLDQLKGTPSGAVNFGGLSGTEVRAQCAMITQAVRTKLPPIEMWILQAKYGETEFEDVVDGGSLAEATLTLAEATAKARQVNEAMRLAAKEVETAAAARAAVAWPSYGPSDQAEPQRQYDCARAILRECEAAMVEASVAEQRAQVLVDQAKQSGLIDSGRIGERKGGSARRRFVFSHERILAIKGISDYFQPQFPRIKPLAMDCMVGRLYANHKKLDISTRDLATQFGGNYKMYMRAGYKLKNQLRLLEEQAMLRLAPMFIEHGVVADFH